MGLCREMAKHTHFSENMWYAIQTQTGREQALKDIIEKMIREQKISRRICERCFFMLRENVWRIHGECRIHTETLFPGYVFIQTQHPQELYAALKQVPQYTRLLGKEEGQFLPISKEEELFLKRLLNGDKENTVRLSLAELDENRNIVRCEGALRYFEDYIIRKRIRMRYVIVRVHLLGKDREVKLGLRLAGDEKE